MNLTSRGSKIVVAAVALALPFKAGGCGSTACITVTAAQLVNGACPSSSEAQARFSDPNCPGAITSVDSAGTLDGNLCCYSVTTAGNTEVECAGTGGSFGDGSFSTEESSSTGIGAGGGTSSCPGTCQAALNGAPFDTVCDGALMALMSLQMCACNAACMTSCDPTLCVGNAPDTGCLSCMQTNCATQLSACHDS